MNDDENKSEGSISASEIDWSKIAASSSKFTISVKQYIGDYLGVES